jgi:hypothetical protein
VPWWAWLIIGGGLIVWVSLVAFVCLVFRWVKKGEEKFDREHEEFVRRHFGARRG